MEGKRRLQLGASRLTKLSSESLVHFLDESWVHLGDPVGNEGPFKSWLLNNPIARPFIDLYRRYKGRPLLAVAEDTHRRVDFRPWFYRINDRLGFDDESFDFIFSEHFLEHLHYDAAMVLLKEVSRILRPGGVARISVPDAVFRTYEPPEPEGFPQKYPPDHPEKHKTRWTVYMLTEAFESVGLTAVPVQYCDRDGHYHSRDLAALRGEYSDDVDPLVFTLAYAMRQPSLIVDGVKAE